MSLTVLSAIGAALATVDALAVIALLVVVWHHAEAIHRGISFNQWENAIFEQWHNSTSDDLAARAIRSAEARIAQLDDALRAAEERVAELEERHEAGTS